MLACLLTFCADGAGRVDLAVYACTHVYTYIYIYIYYIYIYIHIHRVHAYITYAIKARMYANSATS